MEWEALYRTAIPRERQTLNRDAIYQGDQSVMNKYVKTAIILSAAIYGAEVQIACVAQSAGATSGKKDVSQPAAITPSDPPAAVDFAALETPVTDSSALAKEVIAASAAPGAETPGKDAASPSNSASASPVPPLKNEAVVKELAEMKKQFEQMAQMQALMKAKMERLESELTTDATTGDSISAEKDAATLRAAESGDTGSSVTPGMQAATAPPATTAPTPPEINAQTTTKGEPFPGDWTWLNSNGHAIDSPMSTKYFTPEFRADANYTLDYNHPKDDSLGGSTETFRSDEWQLEQISVGGDIRINNVRGRILTMDGLFSTTTVRNDASPSRGQWDLAGAYKYVSEAWGGYHWDTAHGLNVDAGIFVSYIGLFSYYNFDNWTYQPSFVSSNTPWFFNGLRIQYFPTAKLKIEPWIINGWQTYARPNGKPGLGGQILWRPTPYLDFVFNNYGLG